MQREFSLRFVIRYTVFGFLFGFGLTAISYFIQGFSSHIPISLSGIVEIHRLQPVFFFIDLIPVFMAVVAYLFSKRYAIEQAEADKKREFDLSQRQDLLGFVQKIKEGDVDTEYSVDDKDLLGQAIVSLRNTLREAKEEESARRKDDELRSWTAQGLADFAQILRTEVDSIEELSYGIISNLVKYINANQGGFYLLDDTDEHDMFFTLTASYAYDRRKFSDHRIGWGEGLVGVCALERETTHLVKVPDSYLRVTSGLGNANPKNLLLVPLKMNEEVYGVLEIASFTAFEPYKIEFIEKVSESIASTLSSVKTNTRTAKLLRESQEQAQVMQIQEEQMRQNMEELQATQEESLRQSEEFVSFTNSISHTFIRAEFSVDGMLIGANQKFLNHLEYDSLQEVEGKHYSMFVNGIESDWFQEVWETLSHPGNVFQGDLKLVAKSGLDVCTLATFSSISNAQGAVEKILFLSLDITERKCSEQDMKTRFQGLNQIGIVMDLLPDGRLTSVNERFEELFSITDNEATTKKIFDFIHPEYREGFEKAWAEVMLRNPFEGRLKMQNQPYDGEYWLQSAVVGVADAFNEVSKVVFLGLDITQEIAKENLLQGESPQIENITEEPQQDEPNVS